MTFVKIALRIQQQHERECLKVIDNTVYLNDKPFHFDFIYPIHVTQRQVYESSTAPLLDRFFEGENVTLLTLGQRLFNAYISSENYLEEMIHPFAYLLFDTIKDPAFEICISYALVRDVQENTMKKQEDWERAHTAQDLIEILKKIQQREQFSQSHFIFTISLKRAKDLTKQLVSSFCFIDLVDPHYGHDMSQSNPLEHTLSDLNLSEGLLKSGLEADHLYILAYTDLLDAQETFNRLEHLRQSFSSESDHLRAQVSRLKMQVSLLSDVTANHTLETQIKSLKEELEALRSFIYQLAETDPMNPALQARNLKLQIAQIKPESTRQSRSISCSLLTKRFASTSSLDLRRSMSKSHAASTSTGRRSTRRRYGSKVAFSHTPRKSQPTVSQEFIDFLQKPTDKNTLDNDLELSFENFSFTDQSTDTPPSIYPTTTMDEDILEALAVPTWSDEFKMDTTKRTSISVESMWDDTDSSISYMNSSTDTTIVSISEKKDRKENKRLLKMLHQSQADSLVKRELVGQLEKTEEFYKQMQTRYEGKLNELKDHLVEIQRERDTALKRKPPVQLSKQAQALRSEYGVKLKQLISENQELRNKNSQLIAASRTDRVKTDAVIHQLEQDMDKLSVEKKRLTKNLKMETDNAREAAVVYEREIQQLKRRELAALDSKAKMEQENKTMSQLVQKRFDEAAAVNAQMRSLTNTLRKAANAGTFLNEANLEKILNGTTKARSTKRRSTIGAADPPAILLRKSNASPSFI